MLAPSMNPYESQELVDQYLAFHYAAPKDYLPWEMGPESALNFAVRTVEEGFDFSRQESKERALDLGCAVGRSSFELSCHVREVVGIDFSAAFVAAAEEMRSRQAMDIRLHMEGNEFKSVRTSLPDLDNCGAVNFEVGDATDLREDLGEFDLVHAANLICRLPEPEALLGRLPSLVRAGGQLVITTPCTWLGEFTPPEKWPKGPTLEWLQQHLNDSFTLEHKADVPFLIRETARKNQWTVSQLSRWRRK